MAGSVKLVITLAIGLAVICTGVISKECEECPLQKCEKIEESSGKVYGENENPALSTTECPDEQNCCSLNDTLYYATGELAPCACPDKENNRVNDFNGAADEIDESETRTWNGKENTPGWHEKEAFKLLNELKPDKFNDPNTAATDKGIVKSAYDLVPSAESKSYLELFARVVQSGTETGKIYRLVNNWVENTKTDKNEKELTKEQFDKIHKITTQFRQSYELRNKAYNDAKAKNRHNEGHRSMRDAVQRAWSDFEKLEKEHRPARYGAPPP